MKSRRTLVCSTLGMVIGSLGCNPRDAFTAHVDVVARAGDHQLVVDQLGEIIANGRQIPLQLDVTERVARLWVDYTLVVQRLVDGDSLLDSATVVHALWNDAQLRVVSAYHQQLVDQRVVLTDASVDSAYHAGDHRLIYHVLKRAAADMSDEDKAVIRREADQLRQLALRGTAGWQQANEQSDDAAAQSRGGSLGLIVKGNTVPEFERAAFSLAPGGVSDVIETQFGYHIVRRPSLEDAREEFRLALQDIYVERMNYGFIQEVETRWDLEIAAGAPRLMRIAARDLMRAQRSDKMIGTYTSGSFTVADFARWLRVLPATDQARISSLTDEQLVDFAYGLVRNEVLEREARASGHRLTPDDLSDLRDALAKRLDELRDAMALDSLSKEYANVDDRTEVVRVAVERYLAAATNDLEQLVIVPAPLADLLRSETEWEISIAGVHRALDRGRRRRAAITFNPGTTDSAASEAVAKE